MVIGLSQEDRPYGLMDVGFKLVVDGGMHKGIGGNIEKALRHTSMDMSSYNQKGQLISSHHQWNLLITTKS